jgi:hypothetical protein
MVRLNAPISLSSDAVQPDLDFKTESMQNAGALIPGSFM